MTHAENTDGWTEIEDNGKMVGRPRGIAFYAGPTPGYTQLIRAPAGWVPLRIGHAVRRGRSIPVR